jgi:hypothetical protein
MKLTRFAARCLMGVLAMGSLAATVNAADTAPKGKASEAFTTGSSDAIIQFVNQQIREGWENNEVQPSSVSEDSEWLRRVHLDIVGHIPDTETVEKFVADKDKAKRSKVIEKLLDDEGYVRNFTTNWTNLSIGRQTPRRVSRAGMQKFYREAFARNRPWNEVVNDIVTAEGHYEENGAVNYLLAQMAMADDMVQATAKTTRLFLGVQVQCTQCHNHPFNDWQQTQFWEFNSFFRQTRKIDHQKADPKTGRRIDDYSEIVSGNFDGPVYFEKRNGLMQVAYPKYFDKEIDEGGGVERRKEFGKLIVDGEKTFVALAMVNRMWGHFFGYGFTKPIDDMGPHNQASHPALHDRLATEFVKSRYDVKQLIRWICNSEAYNLTSQLNAKNESDNPAAGETPLFSHMYVKSMEAEQLYDSLIIATDAHKSGRGSWEQAEKQRQEWLRQFVLTFGTDENDESTTFNGTIPQALALMNGEVIRNAVNVSKGSYLREVLEGPEKDDAKIKKLYMSTLTRVPTPKELTVAQQMLKLNKDKVSAYQDLFWALLNSNEFIFIH